jgi:hypothetical protein
MRSLRLAGAILVLVVSATAITAQERVARAPTATNQAAKVSQGQAAMDRAAAAQKYIFIFFYAGQDSHTSTMKGVFDTAMAKMTDRADAMVISVADPAEKPIVDKFSVRGAPMPLVLAIAPTGAATRAFPKQFEESQFQQAFVSPCTAKCMRAIQDRHLILLCVQNDRTRFNQEATRGVEAFKADPQYARATEVVVLNPADNAEQHFLTDLQVDPRTTTAVTVLVTPPGAPVAYFEGAVTKEQIAAKVKSAQSGCCPGGKCGPGGCGPKK